MCIGFLFALSSSAYKNSWLVLIRRLGLSLLHSVADAPQCVFLHSLSISPPTICCRTPNAVQHLRVLNLLLSIKSTSKEIGPEGPQFSVFMAEFLVHNGLFSLVTRSIQSIVGFLPRIYAPVLMPNPQPIESKSSPTLPQLIDLIKNALSLPDSLLSPSYRTIVIQQLLFFLTIPLLPYRLPLKSLSILSATLPFSDLRLLSSLSIQQLVESLDISSRVHLLANLASFVPPRYSQLQGDDIALYLRLLIGLLNSLPVSILDPEYALAQNQPSASAQDDSDDDEASHAPPQASLVPVVPHPTLDARTTKRVRTLTDPAHISTLLGLGKTHPSIQLELIMFILALNAAQPAKREEVLAAAGIYTSGGGLVRELYRSYVRSSPLGRDDNPGAILGMLR